MHNLRKDFGDTNSQFIRNLHEGCSRSRRESVEISQSQAGQTDEDSTIYQGRRLPYLRVVAYLLPHMKVGNHYLGPVVSVTVLLTFVAGCATPSPFAQETERDLRRSVIESARRELGEAQLYPTALVSPRDELGSELTIKPE